MKVVRVHSWGEAPRVEDSEMPGPAPGRTIIRMQAATVGHIDRTIWAGKFLLHPPLPYVPGVEGAGTVVASDRFRVGERVWMRGCGLGTQVDGTWREFIAAPDEALGLLPASVPMTLGAAFFSPCASAWVALHDVGRLRPGERVLVTGAAGAVGSIVVQLALEAGARVFAVISDPAAASRLPAGCDVRVVERIAPALSDPVDADVMVDTVGGALLGAMLPALIPGGRAVLVGYTGGTVVSLDLPELLQRDIALLPLNMFRRDSAGRAAAGELLDRLSDGRLRLEVKAFPLHEAGRALEWIVEQGHRGRAVLIPSD